MEDAICGIRVAVADTLRQHMVNCSHKAFVDEVIDRLPEVTRRAIHQAQAVNMLQDLAAEHHDRVLGLCPNGQTRWDVVDVLQNPYGDGVPQDKWLLGTSDDTCGPVPAVRAAGRCC